MAASDPTTDVPTPTGTLQGVAAFSWDGSAWQPAGRAGPSVATPTGVLRGVAAFNGGPAWQPAGRAQPGVATPSGTLDGVAVYTWSGAAWTPPGGQPTPSTPSGALRGVAAFNWDGAAWQPAAQAGPSVATPYGVLDGVAMFNWSGSAWAAAGAPSLSLDFTSGLLDPRIVFTRASTATYFDATGTMQTAAINAPRFDYDPVTHAPRGLLLEDSATNLLLNTAALGTQSVAVTAQAYTLSSYGTGTITLSGASSGALVGTGTQRALLTFTPAAGTLTCTVTGSVTSAQLEPGPFATSYFPSAGTSGVRQKDSCYIPVDTWYTPANYALAAEFDTAVPLATFFCVCGIGDTTAGNASYLSNQGLGRIGGGTTAGHSALIPGAVNKQSGSLTLAALRDCNNGGAIGSATNGQASQTTATRLSIGMSPWALDNMLYGHVRRVRYWPRVLSDAEMQSVTT